MLKQQTILFFIFVLLKSSIGFCEVLTLENIFHSVDHHYPLIMGAKKDIEKSEGDQLSARGGFDPVFRTMIQDTSLGYYNNSYYDLAIEQPTPLWGTKVVTGFRKGVGNFPVYDSKLQTFDQGEVRAGLELPLLRGGLIDERRTRIRSTETGVKAAEQNFASKQLEVKREAAKKYWDWVASGKKLKVAEELLTIARVRDHALIIRVQKGDAAQVDHTDNQRAVVQRQAGVISAQRSLQKATLELSLYYRDPQGTPLIASQEDLPQDFPSPKEQKVDIVPSSNLDLIALNHPDTRTLTLQLEQLGFEQNLAQNHILPRLDINLGLVKDLGINPGTPYIPPSNYPYEFRASLIFEIPLLLRSARGKLDSITASQNKLSFIQGLTRDRLKTQILDSSQAMTAALARIDYTHQEVQLSKNLEEAERIRFQQGDSSLLIINIREQTTRDAMNKEIDAFSDFFKAHVDYQTYTAGLKQ